MSEELFNGTDRNGLNSTSDILSCDIILRKVQFGLNCVENVKTSSATK